ncbi:unnamed protein product [Mesocestoides corti]|uniref:Uncharacterized protein n=1 Tax=Mesocestoides corti TaxID=53468 RepID=A0A0R3U944_MESCO|nr:unnamed protein product [Mesocestoides corti]
MTQDDRGSDNWRTDRLHHKVLKYNWAAHLGFLKGPIRFSNCRIIPHPVTPKVAGAWTSNREWAVVVADLQSGSRILTGLKGADQPAHANHPLPLLLTYARSVESVSAPLSPLGNTNVRFQLISTRWCMLASRGLQTQSKTPVFRALNFGFGVSTTCRCTFNACAPVKCQRALWSSGPGLIELGPTAWSAGLLVVVVGVCVHGGVRK